MKLIALICASFLACLVAAMPLWALEIRAAVLRVDYPAPAPISRFDLVPGDVGFAGATLGNEDNATTGSFLGMEFSAEYVATPPDKAGEALELLMADGIRLIVVLASDDDLLKIADAAGADALILNAMARGTALRDDQCRANILHVAPSHAMMADAVAQFAMWKKWPRWFLIEGSNDADRALGGEYRRAAQKFGAKLAEERTFEDTGGSRRADTGHVLVQRQIPVFTQGASEHDLVIAADASDVFALYLPFHTWSPRPVMGSAGLRPVTFHAAHEAWGATQFQTRFEKLATRYVREEDYQAWLALRVIGEAVIRTNSADPATLKDYAMGDSFELAAFKGQAVTFRNWNGQLRQPILLTDSKVTVSVSPQEGYLHQRTALDTLGLDQPESACTAFEK